MAKNQTQYDLTAITLLAIVAIVAVVIMVIGLPPSEAADQPSLPEQKTIATAGAAFEYGEEEVLVGDQFDISAIDMNQDGILDFYDVLDIFSGAVNCNEVDCDFNDDGYLDAADAESLTGMIIRLYDYDGNGILERDDPRFLLEVMLGNAQCNENFVCDINGDGLVSSQDVTLYTELLYNYDLG